MPNWTNLPEAAALLASCAANPPAKRPCRYRFGDHDIRYAGARVRRLRRLWQDELARLLALADTGRIDRATFRANAELTEQAAIAAAIAARSWLRKAA
jgi:hypothetical protein